jgi:hypothetical protein
MAEEVVTRGVWVSGMGPPLVDRGKNNFLRENILEREFLLEFE